MSSLPAFSMSIWQAAFLSVFALICYLVGLRGWRFAVIFASVAAAILFFGFFYEHMIQALARR